MPSHRLLRICAVLIWGIQTVYSAVLAEAPPPKPAMQGEAIHPEMEARTITLERPVHFMTPDGTDRIVDPGIYTVDAVETNLRLRSQGSEQAIVLDAGKGAHEVKVEVAIALSIPGGTAEEGDLHFVQLLSPGGASLQATGTYSGVRPRGLLDAAKNAAAKAQAAAEAARRDAAALAAATAKKAQQEAALRAQQAVQLALKAKQEAERQAKIIACKATVAAVKAGKAVGAFMSQLVPAAKQHRDGLQQRITRDPMFREQLKRQADQAMDSHGYAVPELGRMDAYVNRAANRFQLDSLLSPDVFCSGSMAAFDQKMKQMGLVPNFAMVRARGTDDSHFYMGIQLTLDGAKGVGGQLGLFGVTDFLGNGGFYFFIGPEAGLVIGAGGVAELIFFPNVATQSFAGWGAGIGLTAGKVKVVAADFIFDEAFRFQGFGLGGGAGVGSKKLGSLAVTYTHAWKL